MNILLDLFLTFAKIGMFTFGGGYAMIAVVEHNCVEKKQWITHDEMMNITVIAESTPGPIAINAATFIGVRMGGAAGVVAAVMGFITPSLVLVTLLSWLYGRYRRARVLKGVLSSLRPAVVGLIASAALSLSALQRTAPFP